jgi:beta-glucanase (GH16 family)
MHSHPTGNNSEDSDVSLLPDQERAVASFAEFEAERRELDWVLSHPEINRSANLVRFLSFICNKYFEGDSQDIREHSIAVHALGRKPSTFDSHADPIVRVTARTLRKKLVGLYEGEGRDRPIRISLPVGHYFPRFISRGDADSADGFVADAEAIPDDLQLIVPNATAAAEVHASQGGPASAQFLDSSASEPNPEIARRVELPKFSSWKIQWRRLCQGAAIAAGVALVFLSGYLMGRHSNPAQRPIGEDLQWGDPIWSDEFDGAARQLPDTLKWTYDLEPQGGVEAKEVFCTTAATRARECDLQHPNAFQDGSGHLVLRAERNAAGVWTLAKLESKGLKSFQYGRIEARMRLPVGVGLWPFFRMVGADKDTVGWPASGSIDIMENVSLTPGSNGLGPRMIRSALHGPRYFGSDGLWHDFKLPKGARVDDAGFHTYGIIWSPGMIQFYVDDPANVYSVRDTSQLPEGGAWVFDHPFYLLIGNAVGGDWAGEPNASTPNPADMLVDYVRVYKIPTVPAPRMQWQSLQVKAGSSAASTVSLQAPTYAGRVHLTCSTNTPNASCSLATSVVDFSDTLSQEDTLTISTDSFTEKGRTLAAPGQYSVTLIATTISGDHSELTMPFEVKRAD